MSHPSVFPQGIITCWVTTAITAPTAALTPPSALVARWRGSVSAGEPIVIESLVDSRFTGRVVETTTVGTCAAVIPEVEGDAFITGVQEWVVDPDDPLGRGFFLG